jgi:hypothetical protein
LIDTEDAPMIKRAPQAFRPRLEETEQRLLTTVLAGMGPMVHRPAIRFRLMENRGPHLRAPGLRAEPSVHAPFNRPHPGSRPGGFVGSTANYINWGVITIVNTTPRTVTFAVAASTYNFGRFQTFTLPSGGRQAYYATFGGPFNSAPTFSVTFDVINHYNTLQVPLINVVNESPNWVPRVGTEGRPYAITDTAGGYNLVNMG